MAAACAIRVSTTAFERIQRIVRKCESVKFFVFNTQQWSESHPLRHSLFDDQLPLNRDAYHEGI
jgi:hypothetical protein